MRVKERRPWSEATERGWGTLSPIKQKVPSGHKKMRVFTLIFFVPKAGLEPARLFKDIGF